jgi:hypothetical protein
MPKAYSKPVVNPELHKKDTLPPPRAMQATIPELAEVYAASYENYLAASQTPVVYESKDVTVLLTKIEAWANVVVLGAALREQSQQQQAEEQIRLEDLELQVAQSGLRTLGTL